MVSVLHGESIEEKKDHLHELLLFLITSLRKLPQAMTNLRHAKNKVAYHSSKKDSRMPTIGYICSRKPNTAIRLEMQPKILLVLLVPCSNLLSSLGCLSVDMYPKETSFQTYLQLSIFDRTIPKPSPQKKKKKVYI